MDRRVDIGLLAATELFRGAPEAALEAALAAAFRRRLEKGEVLLRQEEPAATAYAVIVGRLRVTQTTADGQQIIIRYIGPGEVVGHAALTGAESHAGAVAAIDDTHLFGWPVAAIRRLLEEHPQVAQNALAVLGARYRELQLRLRELATENVERRIANTILRLARQAGRRTAAGIEIAIPVSRQDIAEMCGTTLHTVSRTLSAWEEEGLVESGRRRLTVRSSDALAERAAGSAAAAHMLR